jgi:hypothetical protein
MCGLDIRLGFEAEPGVATTVDMAANRELRIPDISLTHQVSGLF